MRRLASLLCMCCMETEENTRLPSNLERANVVVDVSADVGNLSSLHFGFSIFPLLR